MLSSCYDSDLFVNTNLNDLTCPIGLGVLRNPVFDEHGHVFCLDCIQQWLKKSNLCPINKQKIDDTKLVSELPLKGMINSLEMKQCPNKCAWNVNQNHQNIICRKNEQRKQLNVIKRAVKNNQSEKIYRFIINKSALILNLNVMIVLIIIILKQNLNGKPSKI